MTEFEKADWYYEKIREQVRTEDQLYNQRIISLISMQAFLFATLGLLMRAFLSGDADRGGFLLIGSYLLVASTGILVAFVSSHVISNGRIAMNILRDQWDQYEQELSPEIRQIMPHPRGRHLPGQRMNFIDRGISTGNLPHIFMSVWVLFILVLLFDLFLWR